MATNTETYNFLKPTVGGDTTTWGASLNANWDAIDDLLDGTSAIDGIDIDGGSIDGTPIGAVSASTGDFTVLTATGGSINGATVGASTPATGAFTTLSATVSVSAPVISGPAFLANSLRVGNTSVTGGEYIVRMGNSGDRFFMAPSDLAGNYDFAKEFGFDTATDEWYFEADVDVRADLTVTGSVDPAAFATGNGGFLDEDDMASDSATAVASQQSIRAYVNDNAGATVTISTTTISSDATIDLTLDDTTYASFELELSNVIPATNDVRCFLRFSNDGGSSFRSGASDYGGALTAASALGGAAGGNGAVNALSITNTGLGVSNSSGGISGIIRIHRPRDAKKTMVNYAVAVLDPNAGISHEVGVGIVNTAEANDAVRLFFASGNLASGTVTLRGIK